VESRVKEMNNRSVKWSEYLEVSTSRGGRAKEDNENEANMVKILYTHVCK
jgi:hypothetical protein